MLIGNGNGSIGLWDVLNEKMLKLYELEKEVLPPVRVLRFESEKKWFLGVHKDFISRWHL